MFKRLYAWWRSRRQPQQPQMVNVYGWKTASDSNRPVPVVLRQIAAPKVVMVRKPEWPAPEPKRLMRNGLSDNEIQKRARSWRVNHLPDECAFL